MTKIKRREEENRWIIKVGDGQVEEGDGGRARPGCDVTLI